MDKKYWLICKECGYSKEIYSINDTPYDNEECPICQGTMKINVVANPKAEEPIGDNFPNLDNKEKSPTDTERLMINALAQEIKDYGEERVWNNINTMVLDKRFEFIEMFLSAKRLLETGEY